MKRNETRGEFSVAVIFNNGKKLEATKDSLKIVFDCNKEETNKRLVLHNCLQDMNIVIVSKDIDSSTANRQSWRTRINHDKFEDVSQVRTFLGEKPTFHNYMPLLDVIQLHFSMELEGNSSEKPEKG